MNEEDPQSKQTRSLGNTKTPGLAAFLRPGKWMCTSAPNSVWLLEWQNLHDIAIHCLQRKAHCMYRIRLANTRRRHRYRNQLVGAAGVDTLRLQPLREICRTMLATRKKLTRSPFTSFSTSSFDGGLADAVGKHKAKTLGKKVTHSAPSNAYFFAGDLCSLKDIQVHPFFINSI